MRYGGFVLRIVFRAFTWSYTAQRHSLFFSASGSTHWETSVRTNADSVASIRLPFASRRVEAALRQGKSGSKEFTPGLQRISVLALPCEIDRDGCLPPCLFQRGTGCLFLLLTHH